LKSIFVERVVVEIEVVAESVFEVFKLNWKKKNGEVKQKNSLRLTQIPRAKNSDSNSQNAQGSGSRQLGYIPACPSEAGLQGLESNKAGGHAS